MSTTPEQPPPFHGHCHCGGPGLYVVFPGGDARNPPVWLCDTHRGEMYTIVGMDPATADARQRWLRTRRLTE